MSDLTHFDFQHLHMNPQSKAIEALKPTRALTAELEELNTLHRALLNVDTPNGAPPPPIPVNPKRSANVTKLRDSGNAEFRKGKYNDAIRFYTLALQMATTRPIWEPAALMREEVAAILANRAQAHMSMQDWPEGMVDANISVEMKWVGNPKAWFRKGRCLVEMGRLEEAKEWVRRGLEIEGEEPEMSGLLSEIESKIKQGQS